MRYAHNYFFSTLHIHEQEKHEVFGALVWELETQKRDEHYSKMRARPSKNFNKLDKF